MMSGGRHFAGGVVEERFRGRGYGRKGWGAMRVSKDPDIGTSRLLTVRQAAHYLGTTAASLYTKVWRREISFIKLGRSVRFDVKDLNALIELSKVSAREFSTIRERLKVRK